jgi:hypothetical protein
MDNHREKTPVWFGFTINYQRLERPFHRSFYGRAPHDLVAAANRPRTPDIAIPIHSHLDENCTLAAVVSGQAREGATLDALS